MIKLTYKVELNLDKSFNQIKKQSEKILEQLLEAAWSEWQAEAGRVLNSTRRIYQDSVQKEVMTPGQVRLFLAHNDSRSNFLANAVELGCGPKKIWKSTFSKRKAYFFSSMARVWKDQTKYGQIHPAVDFKVIWPSTPPFMDVPNWAGSEAKQGQAPKANPPFRRMSTRTVEEKWTHKGIKARNISKHVLDYIQEQIPVVFSGLGKVTI